MNALLLKFYHSQLSLFFFLFCCACCCCFCRRRSRTECVSISSWSILATSRLLSNIISETLGVAMGFVGNYAPCGLLPQTAGMPVIQKKQADIHQLASKILCCFLFMLGFCRRGNIKCNRISFYRLPLPVDKTSFCISSCKTAYLTEQTQIPRRSIYKSA